MTNDDALQAPEWFTSSYSNDQGGQCVEAAHVRTGKTSEMWVRDSKNPNGGMFEFKSGPWMDFISSVASGGITDRLG
ncbi:DUF397 domain-containing protein [Streptomyces phaeochromogenes]